MDVVRNASCSTAPSARRLRRGLPGIARSGKLLPGPARYSGFERLRHQRGEPLLVDLATYERAIKSPIRQCLNAVGNDNILYVVLSYATPDVVSDNFAIFSSRSVDQRIVDVWERGLVQLGQLQRRIQLRRRRHRLAPGQLLVGLVARGAGPGHLPRPRAPSRNPPSRASPHPDGVVRNLLEGANVGDAFLRNTNWVRWMIVNRGDPLYRPFPVR